MLSLKQSMWYWCCHCAPSCSANREENNDLTTLADTQQHPEAVPTTKQLAVAVHWSALLLTQTKALQEQAATSHHHHHDHAGSHQECQHSTH